MKVSTFYFSRIIGSVVYSELNKPIGKIKDLIVKMESLQSKVVAVSLKTNNGVINVDFSKFSIQKIHSKYILKCSQLEMFSLISNKADFICLGRYILDRQIVDMNGRKLIRVNDIRFSVLKNETYLIAIDVGFEGLLRRLGLAKPIKFVLKKFGVVTPNQFIIWDDVETVDLGHAGIKLSKDISNLNKFCLSDLSSIIEASDGNTQFKFASDLG